MEVIISKNTSHLTSCMDKDHLALFALKQNLFVNLIKGRKSELKLNSFISYTHYCSLNF